MAKKKTSGPAASVDAAAASPTTSTPATRRRRAAASPAAGAGALQSTADERAEPMPEPAGQRITLPSATASDSVTFQMSGETNPTYEQIAEAAYRRYLSRGGTHGYDVDDWIEAERELKGA